MKTTLVLRRKQDAEIKYPILMKSKTIDCVVLFTERGSGTVVHGTYPYVSIGQTSKSWNMENFEPVIGEVILSNDD